MLQTTFSIKGLQLLKSRFCAGYSISTLHNTIPNFHNSVDAALFNSLQNDKSLDLSKLKAFADNKIKLTEKFRFGLGMVENIVGKGESAGYQCFLLFPQCFQKASFQGLLKVRIVW